MRAALAAAVALNERARRDAPLLVSIELGLANDDCDRRALARLSTRVEAEGGEVLEASRSGNSVQAILSPQSLIAAFCWPDVTRAEVLTPFWDAVPPTWDTSSVGPGECPVIDGVCPEHCGRIEGTPYDVARACVGRPIVAACDRIEGREYPTQETCHASTLSGELFRFGGAAPFAPDYWNYHECSLDESSAVMAAPWCID
ncbi:MAG TPA: hypothetical protein VMG12_16855 [Polyangiaceae bacterium]|nr:hypothetical protein [Polyangiaceae bacterium]